MTRTTIIFFFILFTMNLLGCQSNQIGTYFAQQQAKQSSPQRVGISQFNIIYYIYIYFGNFIFTLFKIIIYNF